MQSNKRIVWLGSSKADLKALPEAVTAQAGYELYRVQCGLEPTDAGLSRRLPSHLSGLPARCALRSALLSEEDAKDSAGNIELARQRLKVLPR